MLYIATLTEMKRRLGIPDDPQDDEGLTSAMKGLQKRFDSHCGRKFLRSAVVIQYLSGGVRSIYLRWYPVESITSIHISDTDEWTADNLVPATDYRLTEESGRIGYGRMGTERWPNGLKNIRVQYAGGFKGTAENEGTYEMPEDVRRAFMMQMEYEWRNKDLMGKGSGSSGTYVSTIEAKFLPEVGACLAPYVRAV